MCTMVSDISGRCQESLRRNTSLLCVYKGIGRR